MMLNLYPRVHRRYTLLPVLGPILEGFGTWLLHQGYSTDCVREHFCAMRRLARLLRQQGIGSVTELSQTTLQACAPVRRLDDHRLAASVRLLERYFESETSMCPAQPLNRTHGKPGCPCGAAPSQRSPRQSKARPPSSRVIFRIA